MTTGGRFVDLSHEIVDGMLTHPGIAAPAISTVLSFEESRARYAPGTEFEIRRIDMVANTGTYLDTPAHRFSGGADLAALPLPEVADLPGIVVDCRWAASATAAGRGIGPETFDRVNVTGQAVLLWTGWDAHWGAAGYLADNPFLTAGGADAGGARRGAHRD